MVLKKRNLSVLFSEDINNIASVCRVVNGYDITINDSKNPAKVTINNGLLICGTGRYEHSQKTFSIQLAESGKHRYDLIYFNPNTTKIEIVKGEEVKSEQLPVSPEVNGFVLYRLHVTDSNVDYEDLRLDLMKRFDDLSVENLVVNKDLVVNGNTTVVNSQNLEVEDNVIVLNRGETGNGVTKRFAGIQIDRGNDGYDAVFVWDENDDEWKIGFYNKNNNTFSNLKKIVDLSNVDQDILPASDSKYTLGGPGKRWYSVYTYMTSIGYLYTFRVVSSLIPTTDGERDLGSPDDRWRDAYFSGNVYVGDLIFQNGWRITEYDTNKNKLPYLRVLNENGDEVFVIYNSSILKLIFKFEMFVKRLLSFVKKIFKR